MINVEPLFHLMADGKITVEKPSEKKLDEMGVRSWPVWTKEASTFDWFYDDKESCYLLEGEVTVTTADGETVRFGQGDFVVFPEGLDCTWEITKPVRKHYQFG